jgi:hypothetical protein
MRAATRCMYLQTGAFSKVGEFCISHLQLPFVDLCESSLRLTFENRDTYREPLRHAGLMKLRGCAWINAAGTWDDAARYSIRIAQAIDNCRHLF